MTETTEITIVELCDVCSVDRKLVDEMIDEGILEPTVSGRASRRLPYSSVRRARTAIHLQRDLGINDAIEFPILCPTSTRCSE